MRTPCILIAQVAQRRHGGMLEPLSMTGPHRCMAAAFLVAMLKPLRFAANLKCG